MSNNGIRSSRLPDLPNAGYTTALERETSDAIMIFMRGVERDRLLLLSIVVDGVEMWIKTAGAAWKGLLIDRDLLRSIYQYFTLQAGPNPAEQLLILMGQLKQQERERWDKRTSSKRAAGKALRNAVEDLRKYGSDKGMH